MGAKRPVRRRGAIGQSVAQALRAERRPYRVVGRSRAGLQAAFGADPLAEVVTRSSDDPAPARAADTIVYLVGVAYTAFRLHPLLMRQTLEAAIAEGVARMVLVGAVYPYGPRHLRAAATRAARPVAS